MTIALLQATSTTTVMIATQASFVAPPFATATATAATTTTTTTTTSATTILASFSLALCLYLYERIRETTTLISISINVVVVVCMVQNKRENKGAAFVFIPHSFRSYLASCCLSLTAMYFALPYVSWLLECM